MKIKSILFLLFFVLPAFLLQAEPNATWEKLNELKSGKKIAVHLKSGGEINGKFKRVEEGQLLITRKNEEIRFKKENIKFVISGKAFSGKKAWIGAAIGFGIGSAYGAYLQYAIGEGYGTAGDRIRISVGFGTLGAAAGVLLSQIGSRGEESVVYSAPLEMHVSVPVP
jgi:preprotein translocase subunit YajC